MSIEKIKGIGQILALLSEMYSKEISEALSKLYIDRLKEFPIEKIEKAANSLMDSHALNRFPTIADFMLHLRPPAETDDRATQAWLKATDKMASEGRWNTVKFDDPIIHHAITRFGGWIEWGNRLYIATPEDLVWIQKDFERVYKNCLQIVELSESPPPLIGTRDTQNMQAGYIQPLGGIKQIGEAKPIGQTLNKAKEIGD